MLREHLRVNRALGFFIIGCGDCICNSRRSTLGNLIKLQSLPTVQQVTVCFLYYFSWPNILIPVFGFSSLGCFISQNICARPGHRLRLRVILSTQVSNFRYIRHSFWYKYRLKPHTQFLTECNLIISNHLTNNVKPRRQSLAQFLSSRLRIGSVD